MATENVIARGLEAVGAHQQAATRAARHNPELHEAVRQLLARGIRRLYAAHRLAAEQLPGPVGQATAPELQDALRRGAELNETQTQRLERVFLYADFSVEQAPDKATQALVDDAQAALADAPAGPARDQALVAAAQLALHHAIAQYGTLRSHARTVGNDDAAKLLGESLDELARADDALTALALHLVASAPATSDGPNMQQGVGRA